MAAQAIYRGSPLNWAAAANSSAPLSTLLLETIADLRKELSEKEVYKKLVQGDFNATTYLGYLCCLDALYKALESAQKNLEKSYSNFNLPKLERSRLIENDIRDWLRAHSRNLNLLHVFYANNMDYASLALDPMKEMVRHIEQLEKEDPLYTIPIIFTYHSLLISEGQTIKEGVHRCFQKQPPQLGLPFVQPSNPGANSLYYFDIGPIEVITRAWQATLDSVLSTVKYQNREQFITRLQQEARGALSTELLVMDQLHALFKDLK